MFNMIVPMTTSRLFVSSMMKVRALLIALLMALTALLTSLLLLTERPAVVRPLSIRQSPTLPTAGAADAAAFTPPITT
jgi:hypothetical protein